VALSKPATSGDQLSPADVHNQLLLIIPTEYVPGIKTAYGDEPVPAVRVNVAVLTQTTDTGKHPTYQSVLWFNARLLGLRKQIGETVLARMVQGEAKPRQSPPWMLQDATTEPESVAYAEQWLTQNPWFEEQARREIEANRATANGNTPAPAPAPAPMPQRPPAPAPAPVPQVGAPPAAPAQPQQAAVPAVDPNTIAALLAQLQPEEAAKLRNQLGLS